MAYFICYCARSVIACFIVFIVLQNSVAEPLLDLSIFHNKRFSVSIFCAYTSYFAIACFCFVVPFYLEDVRGMNVATAGLYMVIYPLVLVFISPLSGALSDKIGAKSLTLIGLFLTAICLIFVAYLTKDYSLSFVLFIIATMGIGNGAFQSPNNSIVMSNVSPDKMGIGGSVNALVRYVGQAMGIAISNVLLYGVMSVKLGKRVTNFVAKKFCNICSNIRQNPENAIEKLDNIFPGLGNKMNEVCCHITEENVKNLSYACYSFKLPKLDVTAQKSVIFLYGTKEPARLCIFRLKKYKYSRIIKRNGFNHCGYLLSCPKDYAEMLKGKQY